MPLADLTKLARRLGVAADSPAASDALDRATARFIAEVGFDPALTHGDTVTLDGNGVGTLMLPASPVVAVTAVTLDGVLLAPTSYALSRRLGMLQRFQGWPWGFGNIVVTYDHGYAEGAMPADIADAVMDAAELIHRGRPGIQSSTLGPQAVRFEPGATQAWVNTVARYRRGGTLPA